MSAAAPGACWDGPWYWAAVSSLILADICVFVLQLAGDRSGALDAWALAIAAAFVAEVGLRTYAAAAAAAAAQGQTLAAGALHHLSAPAQLFDALVVLVAFALALFQVHNILLAARVARLLRGANGAARAVRGLSKARDQYRRVPDAALELPTLRRGPSAEARRASSRADAAAAGDVVVPLLLAPSAALRRFCDDSGGGYAPAGTEGWLAQVPRADRAAIGRAVGVGAVAALAAAQAQGVRAQLKGTRLVFPRAAL